MISCSLCITLDRAVLCLEGPLPAGGDECTEYSYTEFANSVNLLLLDVAMETSTRPMVGAQRRSYNCGYLQINPDFLDSMGLSLRSSIGESRWCA